MAPVSVVKEAPIMIILKELDWAVDELNRKGSDVASASAKIVFICNMLGRMKFSGDIAQYVLDQLIKAQGRSLKYFQPIFFQETIQKVKAPIFLQEVRKK